MDIDVSIKEPHEESAWVELFHKTDEGSGWLRGSDPCRHL